VGDEHAHHFNVGIESAAHQCRFTSIIAGGGVGAFFEKVLDLNGVAVADGVHQLFVEHGAVHRPGIT
jgi:hypothetical protein